MKKRKVNALLAIVLSLTMLVGVTGCGKEQQLEAEINPDTPATEVQFPLKETAELSFITSAPATSTQEPNERVIFQRMEEQTNVHIDWTCFVSDQFSDKKNLALAQFGNLPDGLFNAGMSDYDLLRYAKQGIIIPLENLIDKYMPNLQAVFEKYPEYRTMCTAPDGHIYSFPWIEQLGAGKEAIQAIGDIPYINKKWLDYLGLEIPTTTDELEQVFLLTSPQDMLPEGLEYHTGNGTLCIIGEMDKDTYTLKEQFNQSVDYGIDFYAMQTVEAPDGRRIMIGWMQNWDTLAHRCNDSKWFAQMSLPRELSVKNGRLYQTPIKELDALRKNRVEYNDVVIDNDTITLDRVEGRTIDMELVIRPEDKENVYKKFALRFAQNEKFHTELSFRPYESVLKIDRKFSGTERALVHQRRCLVNGDANELKLRVILDRFSAEVFINDGEQVMSAVMFTEQEANGISFFADGAAKIDVVKYDLV